MKTKVIILLLIISLGINIGLIVRLAGQKPKPRRIQARDIKKGWRHEGLRRRLNLDENQLKAIEAIQATTFEKIDIIRETLELKRAELLNILKEPQPDKVKIQTLVKEIANLQTEIELGLTENILMMKKVLTLEQQQQFFELLKRRLSGKEIKRFLPKHFKPRNRCEPEKKK